MNAFSVYRVAEAMFRSDAEADGVPADLIFEAWRDETTRDTYRAKARFVLTYIINNPEVLA